MDGIKLKDLKKGELFTLKPVEEPRESQIFVKDEYDRSEKKYWCGKWSCYGDGKFISGDKIVYTEFTF